MFWAFILLTLLVSVAGSACGSEGPSGEADNKIVFVAPFNGAWRLLIVNADGRGKPTVAPVPKDWPVDDATWSPDGSKIAYNDFDNLSVVNADGSSHVQLYYDANSYTPFTWSGNSDQIAFVRNDPRHEFATLAIFVVRADGAGRRMLVDGDSPSWSPDGRTIALLRCPFVRVINSDGTGERKLVRFDGSGNCADEGLEILWSRDSGKIAYTTSHWKNPKRSCESSGSCGYIDPDTNIDLCRLHIIRVNESSNVQVVGGGLLGKFGSQCDISWSPDGKEVAFTRNGFLYSVTADRRRERQFVRGLEPSWSPDGNHIAFLRNGTIYVLDAQRHETRRLARADELSWSPDGKALVIARAIKPRGPNNHHGEYVIETMDADGGHVRRIWPRVGTCDCGEPAWQTR